MEPFGLVAMSCACSRPICSLDLLDVNPMEWNTVMHSGSNAKRISKVTRVKHRGGNAKRLSKVTGVERKQTCNRQRSRLPFPLSSAQE
jgi:hypothetical protein